MTSAMIESTSSAPARAGRDRRGARRRTGYRHGVAPAGVGQRLRRTRPDRHLQAARARGDEDHRSELSDRSTVRTRRSSGCTLAKPATLAPSPGARCNFPDAARVDDLGERREARRRCAAARTCWCSAARRSALAARAAASPCSSAYRSATHGAATGTSGSWSGCAPQLVGRAQLWSRSSISILRMTSPTFTPSATSMPSTT